MIFAYFKIGLTTMARRALRNTEYKIQFLLRVLRVVVVRIVRLQRRPSSRDTQEVVGVQTGSAD
jgi:hypothetical protein